VVDKIADIDWRHKLSYLREQIRIFNDLADGWCKIELDDAAKTLTIHEKAPFIKRNKLKADVNRIKKIFYTINGD
jgi:hypothetical protein